MIESKFSLKKFNTFNIDIETSFFYPCKKENDLINFLNSDFVKNRNIFVLGGGSNVLFINDFDGVIINMQNKGINTVAENDNEIYIRVSAGVLWDDFVIYCVTNNYCGSENLSLIPGTVGASPVQNIGAYGVEAKDIIHEVLAINIKSANKKVFSNKECKFNYRDSIFKNELKSKYIITDVIFKLSKKKNYKTEYKDIENELKNFKNIGLKSIRQAIINIRERKLPNIKDFPNVGSFFKNPVIDIDKYYSLRQKFPKLVSYKVGENKIKLAAGQLIEMCNWKNKKEGKVGVYEKQALVIVNRQGANGKEILEYSRKIQESIFEKFNVIIEKEVTII